MKRPSSPSSQMPYQTVGYFIPTQNQGEAEITVLKKAGKSLDRLLAQQGVDIEEVVADFKAARRPTDTRKKSPAKAA